MRLRLERRGSSGMAPEQIETEAATSLDGDNQHSYRPGAIVVDDIDLLTF